MTGSEWLGRAQHTARGAALLLCCTLSDSHLEALSEIGEPSFCSIPHHYLTHPNNSPQQVKKDECAMKQTWLLTACLGAQLLLTSFGPFPGETGGAGCGLLGVLHPLPRRVRCSSCAPQAGKMFVSKTPRGCLPQQSLLC